MPLKTTKLSGEVGYDENLEHAIDILLTGKKYYYSVHKDKLDKFEEDYEDWTLDMDIAQQSRVWERVLTILHKNSVITQHEYTKWVYDTIDDVQSMLFDLDKIKRNKVLWSSLVLWRDYYIETQSNSIEERKISVNSERKVFNEKLSGYKQIVKIMRSCLEDDEQEKYLKLIAEDIKLLYYNNLFHMYHSIPIQRSNAFSIDGIENGELFKIIPYNQIKDWPLTSIIVNTDYYLEDYISVTQRHAIIDALRECFGIVKSIRGDKIVPERRLKSFRKMNNSI